MRAQRFDRLLERSRAAEMEQSLPQDAESIALAIRLQQEDDEMALRNALGIAGNEDGDPDSPSHYSYEQLMQLGQTIGEVSRGASSEAISALRTVSARPCLGPGPPCWACRGSAA